MSPINLSFKAATIIMFQLIFFLAFFATSCVNYVLGSCDFKLCFKVGLLSMPATVIFLMIVGTIKKRRIKRQVEQFLKTNDKTES